MFRKVIVLLCIAAFVIGTFGLALAERSGQAVYESKCKMCHETGLAGAPIFGTDAWKELAKEGIDHLTQVAITGKEAMPPKGACADCSEAELKAAVQYMMDSAK